MSNVLHTTAPRNARAALNTSDTDEFAFGAPTQQAVFRSRRAVAPRRRKTIRILGDSGFLPSYQMVAKIIGYTAAYQRPGIGFSVKARGKIVLTPDQARVRAI